MKNLGDNSLKLKIVKSVKVEADDDSDKKCQTALDEINSFTLIAENFETKKILSENARVEEEYFEEDTKPDLKKLKLDNNIALKQELQTNRVIKHELEEKRRKNTVVHNIRKENQLNHETFDQKRALFVNCYNNFIQMALLREVSQTK